MPLQDFEKLGAFYLGRRIDDASDALTDEIVLYDASDLTTHAVIIGMTGSGKTGLGIGLIEEAALDRVPVLAIDPKGDLGNLMLSFPQLRAADFEPWVDPRSAAEAGKTPGEYAASVAKTWRDGLAEWGQTPERIANLRAAADFGIYTPGSAAATPISVLSEFTAPPAALIEDRDFFAERVLSTVNGLMTLLGIEADPVTSREHILISRILTDRWSQGASLDLAGLIAAIQNPGIERIGVMDLDTFYPAKDRFGLAMRINSLLAAPGFDAWLQGEPLDIGRLLYTASGKPRVSVVSIAHLDDTQRMFFVTLLLAEFLTWVRRQPGSASLRAILYMDEIFGYLPPVANPPTKQLFLTLLKQARAYGVGLVLATQNPVDLDYKALSNAGTWFIGRLQTERDKARVREGLETAAGSENLAGRDLDAMLSGLGKRRFLLHNVHDKAPVVFATRWAMSYLAGPLTRDQLRRLAELQPTVETAGSAKAPAAPSASVDASDARAATTGESTTVRPVVPPGIGQCFLPSAHTGIDVTYVPKVLALLALQYSNARVGIEQRVEVVLAVAPGDGPVPLDWDQAEEIDIDAAALASTPEAGARFGALPASLSSAKNFVEWERQLKRWARTARGITVWCSPRFKVYSRPEESEAQFRIRLQQLGKETRDVDVAKLRQRYEARVSRLEERHRRAAHAVEREAEQARGAKIDTALSFGTAVIGALLGRKRVSVTSASRVGTAMRRASNASKQAGDVRRAKDTLETIQAELDELKTRFDDDVAALGDAYDAQTEQLTETVIKPKSTEIEVGYFGIGWLPV